MIHELLLALNGCHGNIFAYNKDTGMIEVRFFLSNGVQRDRKILGCRRVAVCTP